MNSTVSVCYDGSQDGSDWISAEATPNVAKPKAQLTSVVTPMQRELRAFHSIGKALTSTLNLSEVLSIIMKKTSELVNPTLGSLMLYDENRKQLR